MVKDICNCKDGHKERQTERRYNFQQAMSQNQGEMAQNQSTQSRSQSHQSSHSSNQSNPSWGAMFRDRSTFVEMHLV